MLGASREERQADGAVPASAHQIAPASRRVVGHNRKVHWELRTISIRVLWVEDDEQYREAVGEELADHGFAVRSFADGDDLLGSLDAVSDADIILLDWGLPSISGIDLLPKLRQNGVSLPVVFLTSCSQATNRELAFSRGAQDFIDKTRTTNVLVERLRLAAQR